MAAPARKPSRNETLVKALVRAHRWRRKIESGEANSITDGAADRARLAAIVAERNRPQGPAWRAKVVLLSADRLGTAEFMLRTGLSQPSVWRSSRSATSRRAWMGG